MNASSLRAGVVGVGHLGRHHARLYASLEGVRLVGVVDTDAERAAAIATEHGAEVFPDVKTLAGEIDLASVATPTIHHEEVASVLLDADVPVLVEKPITDSLASARHLIDTAARRGVPLMVGHTERFHPAIAELCERVGRPGYLEIHRLAPFVPRSLDVDVILDLMIHDIDLCRAILGPQEIKFLDASGAAALTEKVDIASVRIRFGNGAAANLTASRISNERVRRIRVFEPGAYFSCDTGHGLLNTFRLVREEGRMPNIVNESVDVAREEPLARELSAFRDAVAGGSAPPCSGEDGYAALELALRIRDLIAAEAETRARS